MLFKLLIAALFPSLAGAIICTAQNTCAACVSGTATPTSVASLVDNRCRWCAQTKSCHAAGHADFKSCKFPLIVKQGATTDTVNYFCEASTYPQLQSAYTARSADSVLAWTAQVLENIAGPKHEQPKNTAANANGIYKMDDENEVRVGILSDWGAGTFESQVVANQLKNWNPDYVMHLGDVYYAGEVDEFKFTVGGQAKNANQRGVQIATGTKGTFLLNGNHEMIDRGFGLFDEGLPNIARINSVPQTTSYFTLENKYWRLLSLDTAYDCYKFHQKSGSRLRRQLKDMRQELNRKLHDKGLEKFVVDEETPGMRDRDFYSLKAEAMRDEEMRILQAKIDKHEKTLQRHLREAKRVGTAEEKAEAETTWGAGIDAAILAKEQDFGDDFLDLGSSLKEGRRGLQDSRNNGMSFLETVNSMNSQFSTASEVATGDLQSLTEGQGNGFTNILTETDAPLSQDQLSWLQNDVKLGQACLTDKRAIIIFTHHQYMGFESPYYGTPQQLGTIIPSGCTVLWIDGHEHALEFFDKGAATLPNGINKGPTAYSRLVGNGGFPGYPQTLGPNKDQGCQPTYGGLSNMQYFDNRVYMDYPSGVLQAKKKILYNGYTTFLFKGPKLTTEYRTFACKGVPSQDAGPDETLGSTTLLASEIWTSDTSTGNIVLDFFTPNTDLLSVPLPSNTQICITAAKNKPLSEVEIALLVAGLLAFCCGATFFTLCCPCAQDPGSCGGKVSNSLLNCFQPMFAMCAKCCLVGMVCAACANCSLWCYKCCGGNTEDADKKKTDAPVNSDKVEASLKKASSCEKRER